MPCSTCGNEKVIARGYCSGCYWRMRRRGTVARKNIPNQGRVCSIDGCERPAHAKGLCAIHYDRQMHPLYNTWKLIRKRYPGEFPTSWCRFDSFLADVGERPGPRHQLRRKDDGKPYSSDNVRWVKPVAKKDCYTPEQRAKYVRDWTLQRKYGIDLQEYERMLSDQGGKCAICDAPPNGDSLSVDHCHSSGAVRGLLCVSCNQMLGYAKDKPTTLERAIAYLARYARQ